MSTEERLAEAYETLENSTEHDYQRVVFEVGWGQGWRDAEGYTAEVKVSGEAAIKVINEESSKTVPWHRVVYVETKSEGE
jgi:kynurenine formamidase